jgi:hypothetical protein
MGGHLRDVRLKPDKYVWLQNRSQALTAPPQTSENDTALLRLLEALRAEPEDKDMESVQVTKDHR